MLAVGDRMAGKHAPAAFDLSVRLAGWHGEIGNAFPVHVFALGHRVRGLLEDLEALGDLAQPDEEAIMRVAYRPAFSAADRHAEVERIVAGVRMLLAHVERLARGARVGA